MPVTAVNREVISCVYGRCMKGDVVKNTQKQEDESQGLAIGIALGVGLGSALGSALDNIGLWLPLGIAIGVALGVAYDSRNTTKESQDPGKEDE